RAAEEGRQRSTLKSTGAGQADLGKICRFGHTDVRVGHDELLLGLPNVGSAFEQRRRQACRNIERARLIDEGLAARHRRRVAANQRAQQVLLLFDRTFEIGDDARCLEYQLFGLTYVEQRRGASLLAYLREPQRLLTRRQRALRDLEFHVQLAQVEVRIRHLADQARDNRATTPFTGEERRASRFG